MKDTSDSLKDFTNCLPKLKQAWSSISDVPFNPDLNTIKFLLEHGVGFFKSSEVGFYGFTLGKHLLTSVPRADVVTIFVYPQYRGTSKAKRLICSMLKHAKQLGAKEIYFSVPSESDELFSWSYHYGAPVDQVFRRTL